MQTCRSGKYIGLVLRWASVWSLPSPEWDKKKKKAWANNIGLEQMSKGRKGVDFKKYIFKEIEYKGLDGPIYNFSVCGEMFSMTVLTYGHPVFSWTT